MQAVILAAGRGSRMKEATADKPKCLNELLGRSLLHWQLKALKEAQIENILVVTGYLSEKIAGDFQTVKAPHWTSSNMVETLRNASAWLEKMPTVVSYSDIVYCSDHVKSLIDTQYDIAITYDKLWEKLWSVRFEDPLSDAEIFLEENGILKEIGQRATNISEIHGQYMGLLYFTPKGWGLIKNLLNEFSQDEINALDMTALLNICLTKKIQIGAIPVYGKWCEADSMKDIEVYQQKIVQEQIWSHDWRS